MIFVTLGTHELGFKRMLQYLQDMNIDEEIIIDSGYHEESNEVLLVGFGLSFE